MSLILPSETSSLVTGDVAKWGAQRCETGLFLLAAPGRIDTSVDVIAWPGEVGVIRRRDAFAVSGVALARLFDWATDHERAVVALVHSHGEAAFLSSVDLDHGFSVPGFISAIVPFYKEPSSNISVWGWWRFTDGEWDDLPTPREDDLSFTEITFDERGVQ
jgi:hypothetical protein